MNKRSAETGIALTGSALTGTTQKFIKSGFLQKNEIDSFPKISVEAGLFNISGNGTPKRFLPTKG